MTIQQSQKASSEKPMGFDLVILAHTGYKLVGPERIDSQNKRRDEKERLHELRESRIHKRSPWAGDRETESRCVTFDFGQKHRKEMNS